MVYCAGLENRRAERLRGFESHPLRVFARRGIVLGEAKMESLPSRQSHPLRHDLQSPAAFGFESDPKRGSCCLCRAQRDFVFPCDGSLAHADGLAIIAKPREAILRNTDRRILPQRQDSQRDAFCQNLRRESEQADLPRTTKTEVVVDVPFADSCLLRCRLEAIDRQGANRSPSKFQ